jgi:predicted dehydrogenase
MAVAQPVRVVVVGCGAVSQNIHVPVLQVLARSGEVRVVGLVDPAVPQRDLMATSFPEAAAYDDLAACPLDGQTLVIVASPPRFHAPQSIDALRRGAAVLCEKPMAVSVADAEAMLAAARETRGLLAVGIFRRFFPAFEALKAVFDRRPLGELRGFAIQEGGKFGWGAASDSFFRRDMTMGGVFYDVGVYVVDLLLWLMGEPLDFVYEDDAMGGVEANCRLELTYPRGVRGTVRLSRDWQTRNRYDFHFERGTVTWRAGHGNRLHLTLDGVPFALDGELAALAAGPGATALESPTPVGVQSFTVQMRNVLAAMRGEEPLRVPGEQGVRSLRFIATCYENRRLIEMPWLTAGERASAEALAGGAA